MANGASESVEQNLAEPGRTDWGFLSIGRASEKAGLGAAPSRTCFCETDEQEPFVTTHKPDDHKIFPLYVNHILRYRRGMRSPSPALAFLLLSLVALLQWPFSRFIQQGQFTIGILGNELLVVAGLPLLVLSLKKIPLRPILPFRRARLPGIAWTVLMTLALCAAIDYLTFWSERIVPPNPAVKNLLDQLLTVENGAEGAWRWLLIGLTPAFCEELFFRGFFQNTLQAHWKKGWALCVTAAAFALIHGIPAYWHLYLLLGFYLSWLMAVGKNLWLPIAAHLVNNTWTFLTHLYGVKITQVESWQIQDSLVFAVSVIVFALAAHRFRGAISLRQKD